MGVRGNTTCDTCRENDLAIGGTLFQHKIMHKIMHKLVWIPPVGKTENQIYHILMNGKYIYKMYKQED